MGRGRANPAAMILSGAMMLDWLGRRHGSPSLAGAGERLRLAVGAAIASGKARTPDAGGTASTEDFAAAVERHLGGAPARPRGGRGLLRATSPRRLARPLGGGAPGGRGRRPRARAAAAAAEFGGRPFADLDAALAAGPDLVDIVAPPSTYLSLIERTTAAGVPTIYQKPFCGGLDGARRAARLADHRGVPLVVHENFRFQP